MVALTCIVHADQGPGRTSMDKSGTRENGHASWTFGVGQARGSEAHALIKTVRRGLSRGGAWWPVHWKLLLQCMTLIRSIRTPLFLDHEDFQATTRA